MNTVATCEKIQAVADSARQLSKSGKSDAAAQMRRVWALELRKALCNAERAHDSEIANIFNKLAAAKGGYNV